MKRLTLALLVVLALATLGMAAARTRGRGRVVPSTAAVLSSATITSAAVAGGTSNTMSCGSWTPLNGAAAASWMFELKCSGGCNVSGTSFFFLQRNTSGNRQFQFGVNARNLQVGIAATASTMLTKTESGTFPVTGGDRYRFFFIFDGAQVNDEDRIKVYVTAESKGRAPITLTDSGGAIPATLPTSAATTGLNPSGQNFTFDWIDNVAVWAGYALTAADMCRLDGGSWTGSACVEGTYPGAQGNPLDAAIVSTAPIIYYRFDGTGDSSALIRNQANPGTFDCTPSDGSLAFVNGSGAPDRFPMNSVLNSAQQEVPADVETDNFVVRKFRQFRGWNLPATTDIQAYTQQAKMMRISGNNVRMFYSAGNSHADPTMRPREAFSRNLGLTWPWGMIDYPFSPEVELYRDLTVADVTSTGNGDRGAALTCRKTRDASQQGTCLLQWHSVPTISPPERYIRGASTTNWYVAQPTYTYVATPFNSGVGTQFDSEGCGDQVETFGGKMLWPSYVGDIAASTYKVYLNRAANTESFIDPASWDEHFLIEDGSVPSRQYQPEEPTVHLIKGGPHHGRLLYCLRADGRPPGGDNESITTCSYTDSPDAATPTLATQPGAEEGSIFDWNYPHAWHCGLDPLIKQLANGTLLNACSSNPGDDHHGDFCIFKSVDWGDTWSQVTCLTEGVDDNSDRSAQVGQFLEYEANKVRLASAYELISSPNTVTQVVWTLAPDLFATGGPMPAWANDGCLRLNDGGATNEVGILGAITDLYGASSGAITLSFYSPAVAGPSTLFEQWSGTGQLFQIEADTPRKLIVRIDNAGSDYVWTSNNNVWSASAWHRLLVVNTAGVLAVYLDGSTLSPASTSGSMPATMTVASGSEARLGLRYDGAQPCASCFFDEVAEWSDLVPNASQANAFTTGSATDPRSAAWGVPMHYWPVEGSAGSDLFDSVANLRILDYGFAHAELWGDCSNCEAGDLGASIP
jgi:hypothetical protein